MSTDFRDYDTLFPTEHHSELCGPPPACHSGPYPQSKIDRVISKKCLTGDMNALPLSYYNFSAASYVPRSTEVGKDDSLTRIIFVVAIIIHRVPFQGLSILRP